MLSAPGEQEQLQPPADVYLLPDEEITAPKFPCFWLEMGQILSCMNEQLLRAWTDVNHGDLQPFPRTDRSKSADILLLAVPAEHRWVLQSTACMKPPASLGM